MERLVSFFSHILFYSAFLLAVIAVLEKLVNLVGYKVISIYTPYYPSRILEVSAIALFFVIALQLREIKLLLKKEGSKEKVLDENRLAELEKI